jgi:hypothetical protein
MILELIAKSNDSIQVRMTSAKGTEHVLDAGPDTVWGIPGTRVAPRSAEFPRELWDRARDGAVQMYNQRDVLVVGYSIEI